MTYSKHEMKGKYSYQKTEEATFVVMLLFSLEFDAKSMLWLWGLFFLGSLKVYSCDTKYTWAAT